MKDQTVNEIRYMIAEKITEKLLINGLITEAEHKKISHINTEKWCITRY